jgi:small subunit ribosomal protein S1
MIEETRANKIENEANQESEGMVTSEKSLSESLPEGGSTIKEGLTEPRPQDEVQEWGELYDKTLRDISEGEIIRGTVVNITDDAVMVDIGYKSEGTISIQEFRSPMGEIEIKIGDQVDVYLEQKENNEGIVVLSREKAEKIKVWDEITHTFEKEGVVQGLILGKTKGGLMVDIGVKAFLPGSQIDLRPIKDLDRLVGKTFPMKVIKLNQRRGNIVLSRRVYLEEERKEERERTLGILEEGKVVKGKVKNLTEYGAFVDLGGIDGLLHITDMSWGRINHPSELFVVGDDIEVVVLKLDRENQRVSLGLKQRSPDPWESADERYPVGGKVKGKVVSLVDYGAFVELEPGIEGLVHVSEMSWKQRIKHPSKMVAIGDIIEIVVLDIDKKAKRISLGMKQAEPNPWMYVEEKYPVGIRVKGGVRNLTEYGAFVELEDGLDGLIHISDMSWTKRVRHPSEILKKGDWVETMVLRVDKNTHRISLGLKQAQADPWQTIVPEKYKVGMDVKGRVVRLMEFGAFVELEDGIECLLHISEMRQERVAKPEEVVTVGDEITTKIIKLDTDERKIGLSIRAYLQNSKEEKEEDMG